MQKESTPQVIGIISSMIGLVILMAIFNSGNNTPLALWPSEAFDNLAFSIGWLTRISSTAAYIVAIFVFVIVVSIFYMLGKWLYLKIAR